MGRLLGRLTLGTLLLGLLHLSAIADTFRTLTSGWVMGDVAAAENSAWVATGGGLLKVDQNGSTRLFNTDDGLPSVRLSTIVADASTGYLWLGFEDAYICVFDPASEKVLSTLGEFHENTTVEAVKDLAVGDTLIWALTEMTLSSLTPVPDLPGRYVVKQTYRQFGAWPTGGTFSKIIVHDGAIYMGGPQGVLRGDLNLDLLNPANWEYFDWTTEFGVTPDENTDVDVLVSTGGRLFLSGGNKTFVWTTNGFTPFGDVSGVNGLVSEDDGNVFITRWNGVTRYDSEGNNGELISGDIPISAKSIELVGNRIYTTTRNNVNYPGGLLVIDGTEQEFVFPDTPISEGAQAIASLSNGEVVVAGYNSDQAGISRFDGLNWTHYLSSLDPGVLFTSGSAFTSIAEDGQGSIWIGSSGSGVYVISPLPTGEDTLVRYTRDNSTLSSYQSSDSYVIVKGILRDPSGGLWITNALTYDGIVLHYVPRSWLQQDVRTRDANDWIAFDAVANGIPDNRLGKMVMDGSGRIWIGYPRVDNAGDSRPPLANQPSLVMFDPAGTPQDSSDDIWRAYNWNDFDFASNLALDESGLLWLSTEVGLFWIDTNLPASQAEPTKVTNQISDLVQDVLVDPLDQVWITTDFGAGVLAQDRYTWVRRYTTAEGPYPSPLIESSINTIGFLPSSGEAWLATTSAITVVNTPYRAMGGELGEIEVAPQPFMVGSSGESLVFSTNSLVSGATVRIYTPSGRLVRQLSFDEAVLEGWDGRDSDGEWVASGVYLILVTEPGGESKVGKAAVVRE